MFEKVNPSHPDKIADRIAGAFIDEAYRQNPKDPKVAVEVLIGHAECNIICETSQHFDNLFIRESVERISNCKDIKINYLEVPQDPILNKNQTFLRCGDNGIFCGVPTSCEEMILTEKVSNIYNSYPFDGKYIYENGNITICQSHIDGEEYLKSQFRALNYKKLIINPLGPWTGGIDVDSGATNRKLGSDMGRAVTGGGLHGKDLSKADVSVNIYLYLLAQQTQNEYQACCSIGDEKVKIINNTLLSYYQHSLVDKDKIATQYIDYQIIVEKAREYVNSIGGFEKFADWGLIRP